MIYVIEEFEKIDEDRFRYIPRFYTTSIDHAEMIVSTCRTIHFGGEELPEYCMFVLVEKKAKELFDKD